MSVSVVVFIFNYIFPCFLPLFPLLSCRFISAFSSFSPFVHLATPTLTLTHDPHSICRAARHAREHDVCRRLRAGRGEGHEPEYVRPSPSLLDLIPPLYFHHLHIYSTWHYLRSPHPRSSISSLPICTRPSIHAFSMCVLANSPPASAPSANPPASRTTACPAPPIRPPAGTGRRSATDEGRCSTRI
jgi:hypothetical protein